MTVLSQKQKKARAEGYDEGDYTLFRTAKVSNFLQTEHPLEVLSLVNEVGWFMFRFDVSFAYFCLNLLPILIAAVFRFIINF